MDNESLRWERENGIVSNRNPTATLATSDGVEAEARLQSDSVGALSTVNQHLGLREAPVSFLLSSGFTKLDNATDMAVIASLPNALVKPYLFLASRRSLRAENRRAHWAEVAAFCDRSQRQAHEALTALAELGIAESDGKTWGFRGENVGVSVRKSSMSESVKTVQHEEKQAPEVREVRERREEEKKDNNKAQESTALGLAEGFELIEIPQQHPATSLEIVSALPETLPAKTTVKTKVPRGAALPELPDDLAAMPGMPQAWADWLEFRRQKRWGTVPMTVIGMFAKLREFAAEGQNPVEVVQNSIANDWRGLFPVKPKNLRMAGRPQTTEEADARALQTAQSVYAALQEDVPLAF